MNCGVRSAECGVEERWTAPFVEVCDFAVRVGGQKCFPGWPRRTVEEYLCGHLLQGTCLFVRGREQQDCHGAFPLTPALSPGERGKRGQVRAFGGSSLAIVGLGVGWQLNEAEVMAPGFAEQPWHWQGTNPLGNSFFVADLMATERRAMGALAAEVQWRWPQWRRLKWFSVRRGKVVRYEAEKWFGRMERL